MSRSLKRQTVTGMLWTTVQRFGTVIISFITNLVLARLLTPKDFGMVGMLMVFIAIADTLIMGGLGSALIQKKKPTDEDYSTVFYWNLMISIVFFILLFLTAPAIAEFYKMPQLGSILRVQGLVLIVGAFNMVQRNQLVKQLKFKKIAQIEILAMCISSVTGIVMAFLGFGVWSLVIKMLLNGFVISLILWFGINWRPLKVFSLDSFKSLFRFGSFMLISNLIETVYTNIQVMIVGRFFSASTLGYYTQAKNLNNVPTMSLSSIVDQVSFPVFSQLQDNLSLLKAGLKKNIKAITFLNFPLSVLLIVIAEPLFKLLFTSKWDASVPFFKILCVFSMLYTINRSNVILFKAVGKINLYLYIQIATQAIGIFFIFVGLQFSLMGMMWGVALTAYISFFINAYYSGKILDYGIQEQLNDVGLTYLLSVVIGIIVWFITISINYHFILLLLLQIGLYTVLYLGFSYLLKIEGLLIYWSVIKELTRSKK